MSDRPEFNASGSLYLQTKGSNIRDAIVVSKSLNSDLALSTIDKNFSPLMADPPLPSDPQKSVDYYFPNSAPGAAILQRKLPINVTSVSINGGTDNIDLGSQYLIVAENEHGVSLYQAGIFTGEL